MSHQTLNLVNNIVINAEKRGVAKLPLENKTFDGKNVIYNDKKLTSFGSYGYLGLETDERLKSAAIESIIAYGVQYPSSLIYSSLPLYAELIKLLKKMFESNVLVTTSLSLGHIGVMQTLIHRNDLLILDQHVHASVQDAAQRLRSKGVNVEIIRHNDTIELEARIKKYSNKYEKIWYAFDGIYSMFGDVAPIVKLEFLLNKYSNFYLYADDAHGISSFGKNGSGWILSKIKLHERLILTTGLAKAFGTMGGVFVIPNKELYSKAKNCTGSLIFSGPIPIPMLGASVQSAKIHLSKEIIIKQRKLQEKISYCHELLKKKGVPNLSEKETPIFFIAIGKLNGAYNLVKKMIEDGFLTNLATFPAVSEACAGIRFTITLYHTLNDIDKLVNAFTKNYPIMLKEENITINHIKRSFKKNSHFPDYIIQPSKQNKSSFKLEVYNSVDFIKEDYWNNLFSNGNTYNWKTLLELECVFKNNVKIEHNWDFKYIIIKDFNDEIVLATFFTIVITKEDMLSSKFISEKIEKRRKKDPYYLSEKVLMMGTKISEGSHLYLDRKKPKWKNAISFLLKTIENLKEDNNINRVLLRDFRTEDMPLSEIFEAHSYLKIDLPNGHIIKKIGWGNDQQYIYQLNKKKRKYIKDKVLNLEGEYQIEIISKPREFQIKKLYSLYQNVSNKNHELNTFTLPEKLFQQLSSNSSWELLSINVKGGHKCVAMMLSFVAKNSYHPIFIGMDYSFQELNIYPQMLWQIVKRANELKKKQLVLGYTASQNKRKFGAEIEKRFIYVKSKDNYNQMRVNFHHA